MLDDDVTEIYKTEQMISAYEEIHPEREYITACHTEIKTFMEMMCDRSNWAYGILFMDIYLPDGNGIECGEILRDKGFTGVIIYRSSTAENRLDAFAVDAMQYLIKPVSEEKLFETLDEAIKRVMTIEQAVAEYSLYPDDSDVPIQTENVKPRKSIKEFLTKWFHGDL